MIKKLQINISFTKAMKQIPTYGKFMKKLLTKKRIIVEQETMELEARCSVIIQRTLPKKSSDLNIFTLLVAIRHLTIVKALIDLGAIINLMLLSMLKKIGSIKLQSTRITLQLANKTVKHPCGVVEDLLIKVDKFYFLVDFMVMDTAEDAKVPLILGRPFMKIVRVIIDLNKRKLKVIVEDEEVNFNVFDALKYPAETKECFKINTLEEVCLEAKKSFSTIEPLGIAIMNLTNYFNEEAVVAYCLTKLNRNKELSSGLASKFELNSKKKKKVSQLELKQLPPHLKYFLPQRWKTCHYKQ